MGSDICTIFVGFLGSNERRKRQGKGKIELVNIVQWLLFKWQASMLNLVCNGELQKSAEQGSSGSIQQLVR